MEERAPFTWLEVIVAMHRSCAFCSPSFTKTERGERLGALDGIEYWWPSRDL